MYCRGFKSRAVYYTRGKLPRRRWGGPLKNLRFRDEVGGATSFICVRRRSRRHGGGFEWFISDVWEIRENGGWRERERGSRDFFLVAARVFSTVCFDRRTTVFMDRGGRDLVFFSIKFVIVFSFFAPEWWNYWGRLYIRVYLYATREICTLKNCIQGFLCCNVIVERILFLNNINILTVVCFCS